jgi:hypothetical protein
MHPEYENQTAKVKSKESQLQCIRIVQNFIWVSWYSMGFVTNERSVFAVVLFKFVCEKGVLSENDLKMLRIMFSEF